MVPDSLPVVHRLRFRLGLGPDLPWADYPSPGILRLSTVRFLSLLSLLIPAFSLLYCPASLPLGLLPVQYAPLPSLDPKLRWHVLAPFIFGAGLLDQ